MCKALGGLRTTEYRTAYVSSREKLLCSLILDLRPWFMKRGTAEQWIKEGKQAVRMTRLSGQVEAQNGNSS
jgi:hypothetical protein